MKRFFGIMFLTWCCSVLPIQESKAQIAILEIIKIAIKKVIKAMDLQVQRIQNETIKLQNIQKTLENEMAKLKLDEINGWVKKQKELYAKYYEELQKVKSVIAYYKQVKDIIENQSALVRDYKYAWTLFQSDKHFSPDELKYISQVYNGILEESIKNVDQLFLVINSFATQMTDGQRLQIINSVAENVENNYSDLRQFNQQNKMLSLQRASDASEIEYLRKLYGL